ncbi:hypothetical protein CL634_03810 [bacterium]|nr:hypothetical protein [bacterium]
MKEFKYTTTFSSTLKPLVSEEKDKYLAMASLMEIAEFVPDIDTSKDFDLLPIAFNACVCNRVNKNGDVIDTDTSLKIYKNFINKPINIEHNRDRIVGTILAAGFSEFGTDRPLTLEEVKGSKSPFNITLGGVIWKVASSELADLIEDSADPTSENYLKISASWELGFTDYHLVILPEEDKNIENGEFITNAEEIDRLSSHLRALGGDGKLDNGKNVYRQVVAEVVPLGIGLTETPAADVKGVATEEDKKEKLPDDQENNSSQTNNNEIKSEKIMKKTIENINEINESSLTELSASTITDFIKSELEKAADQYQKEMTEKEEALDAATEKSESLQKEHDQLTEELVKVKDALGELEKVNTDREAEEEFNQRMSALDEEYELTDEDREVIASDIKDMEGEDFTTYQQKLSVLLKSKSKTVIAAEAEAKKQEEVKASVQEEKKEEVKEVVASEETTAAVKEVVEEVLDNAEAENDNEVPVSSEAQESTIYDKYAKAFGIDQFDIKIN